MVEFSSVEYTTDTKSSRLTGIPRQRLVRKTICFSKTVQMHDIVIGLFVNRYAFGRAI